MESNGKICLSSHQNSTLKARWYFKHKEIGSRLRINPQSEMNLTKHITKQSKKDSLISQALLPETKWACFFSFLAPGSFQDVCISLFPNLAYIILCR